MTLEQNIAKAKELAKSFRETRKGSRFVLDGVEHEVFNYFVDEFNGVVKLQTVAAPNGVREEWHVDVALVEGV